MIEQPALALNTERAQELAASGIYLVAAPNTPLCELMNFSSLKEETSPIGSAVVLAESDTDPHNARMEGFADFLADAVSKHVDFARNVVTPALDDIMSRLTEAVSKIQVDRFIGFSINEVSYPPIMDLEQFKESLSRFDTGTTVVPSVSFKFPNYTDEQIIEACETGSANIDTLIVQWLQQLKPGMLQVLWQSVFQDKVVHPVSVDVKPLEDLIKDFDHGIDYAVILFLLCERLSQNIGAEVGMELQEARDAYVRLRTCAVTSINFAMKRIESFNITNTVVKSYDKLSRTLDVNRQVYREWIAKGGKIEVLFGLMVLGRNAVAAGEIDAMKEEALKAWTWYQRVTESEQDAKFVGDVKTLACSIFDESLTNITSDAEKEAVTIAGTTNGMSDKFRALLNEVTSEQIRKNYLDVVWRAACQARFGYTNAYAFLSEMNHEIQTHQLSPQDAASEATLTYVCEYIADMIEVTK